MNIVTQKMILRSPMGGRNRHRVRGGADRGTAIVDLAIVLPLFMLLILGIFDFSRAYWSQSTLGHVAREAARFASVRSVISDSPATQDTITAHIMSQVPSLDPEKLEIDTTWLPTNNPGAVVRVSLTYQFDPLLPLVIADSVTLASSSQMTISF